MSILEIKNISKEYRAIRALDNFSFTSKNNEFVVLVGPSGSGKTTLLKILAGLDNDFEGEVLIDKENVDYLPIHKRGFALVFQNYALYPQYNVYNNLALALRQKLFYKPLLDKKGNQVLEPDYQHIKELKKQYKNAEKCKKEQLKLEIKKAKKNKNVVVFSYQRLTEEEIKERIDKVVNLLELTKNVKQIASTLSGGEKQRVALAKAIVREPKVLLLDEPLSNIDGVVKTKAKQLILNAHKKNNFTTFLVCHDQADAMELADRIVVINEGKIEQVGTPKEIYEKPNNLFVARFFGDPPINLIKKFGKAKQTIGVRPENVRVNKKGKYCGEVDHVELYGLNSYVHIKAFETTIMAKTKKLFEKGDKIKFDFVNGKIIYFDENGVRINK